MDSEVAEVRSAKRIWIAFAASGVLLAALAVVLVPPKVTAADVQLAWPFTGPGLDGGGLVPVRVRVDGEPEPPPPVQRDDVSVVIENASGSALHRSLARPGSERASIRVAVRRVDPTSDRHLPDVPGRRFMIACRCSGELEGVTVEPETLGPFRVEAREFARPVLAAIVEDAMLDAVCDEIVDEVRAWCVDDLQHREWREARDLEIEAALQRFREQFSEADQDA